MKNNSVVISFYLIACETMNRLLGERAKQIAPLEVNKTVRDALAPRSRSASIIRHFMAEHKKVTTGKLSADDKSYKELCALYNEEIGKARTFFDNHSGLAVSEIVDESTKKACYGQAKNYAEAYVNYLFEAYPPVDNSKPVLTSTIPEDEQTSLKSMIKEVRFLNQMSIKDILTDLGELNFAKPSTIDFEDLAHRKIIYFIEGEPRVLKDEWFSDNGYTCLLSEDEYLEAVHVEGLLFDAFGEKQMSYAVTHKDEFTVVRDGEEF